MRRVTGGLLMALSVTGWASAAGADGKASEIDGTWELTRVVCDGEVDENATEVKVIFVRKDGNQEVTRDGKPFSKATFTVDTSKSPKELTFLEADGKTRLLCIYEIKGNDLKIAELSDAKEKRKKRPTTFKEGTGVTVVYCKRVKSAARFARTGRRCLGPQAPTSIVVSDREGIGIRARMFLADSSCSRGKMADNRVRISHSPA